METITQRCTLWRMIPRSMRDLPLSPMTSNKTRSLINAILASAVTGVQMTMSKKDQWREWLP